MNARSSPAKVGNWLKYEEAKNGFFPRRPHQLRANAASRY
jgi:hypothetical protein